MITVVTTVLTIVALSAGLRSVNPIALTKTAVESRFSTPASNPPKAASGSPSPSSSPDPRTREPDELMANLEARSGHLRVVVSWVGPTIPGALVTATSAGQDGSRSKGSCVASAATCSFKGLTDGVEYVVTVKQKLGGTTLATKIVRAIPHPDILTSRFSRLWFDAADSQSLIPNIEAADRKPGTSIKRWLDRSGLGSDAEQVLLGSQPTVTTLHGHSALAFSGQAFLSFPAATLPIGAEPSSVYLVVRQQDPSPLLSCFRVALSWGSGQPNLARLVHKGCRTKLAFAETFATWASANATQEWPDNRPAILRANFTAAGVDVDVNGKPSSAWKTSTAFPLATAAALTATIGSSVWDPNGAWLGEIAEVIVLSSIPSPAQDQDIQNYLSLKWGV
jgi:hypothetical protein